MEFRDLIHKRESVRSYDPARPVPREILERILDAGRLAPSAANRQPWRFYLVSSPEMLKKVRMCYGREWFRNAPHVLVVSGKKDQAWKRGSDSYNSVETDAAIAMTHMLLAAANEGVATCWIANFDPVMIREALKPGQNEVIFAMTPLGYPLPQFEGTPEKIRKNMSEVAEFI